MKKIAQISTLVMFFALMAFSVPVKASSDDKDLKSSSSSEIRVHSSAEDTYGAAWEFPEYTNELIDSYAPFIFRTKKSAEIEELRVILNVNEKGKISGYQVLNDNADRGLVERMGFVLRQLPKPQAVPGFETNEATDFLLTIKK